MGSLDLVKKLINKYTNIDLNDGLSGAIVGGDKNIVQFLIHKILIKGEQPLIDVSGAAWTGDLEFFKYIIQLQKQYCPGFTDLSNSLRNAVEVGAVDIIRYLDDMGVTNDWLDYALKDYMRNDSADVKIMDQMCQILKLGKYSQRNYNGKKETRKTSKS